MAAITTYATLLTAIQDTAEDDGAEFLSYIPTAIDLAEERLFKELELTDLETKATGALTINSVTLAKPTGYKYANYFKINNLTTGQDVILIKKREDYLVDYWPNTANADLPKYYADYSSTLFRVTPTPNLAYTYEIKYTKQPDKLSVTTTTNYYTDNCKDCLFASCMLEMSIFMKAWTQVQFWQNQFNAARDTWNLNAKRQRRDDGSQPLNPEGPNTLESAIKG